MTDSSTLRRAGSPGPLESEVLVIGAGIGGSLCACLLRDAGVDVRLIDSQPRPMQGASRWNEGKIHLGFVYTGTPSLESARLMLEGAAVFEAVLGQLGVSLSDQWYSDRVVYLVDENSIFPADLLWQRATLVADLLQTEAERRPGLRRYLGNEPVLRRLDGDEAASRTKQGRFVAAWETAERSLSARPLADEIAEAVRRRDIPFATGRVRRIGGNDNLWTVETDRGALLSAPVVVNCSWESRPALDAQVTPTVPPTSVRYKRALFGRGLSAGIAPSTRILGPFGDVTPYRNGDCYLSWYPIALAGQSEDGTPPAIADIVPSSLIERTLAIYGFDGPEWKTVDWTVAGGYIVARGHGNIADPASPLHSRSEADARELRPGYISLETGKFSLGPLLAARAARLALARLGRSAAAETALI